MNGTPLPLGPGLDIGYVQRLHLGAIDELTPGHTLVLGLDFARLKGETMFPTLVYFNGLGLTAVWSVITDTNPPNTWQITALDLHKLFPQTTGQAQLSSELGLTYMGPAYNLPGMPLGANNASELSGNRTSEVYITQELPEPLIGVRLHRPLAQPGHSMRNF